MIEFVAVIFSLLCVWLTAKKNILCWPIGIIGMIGYAIIFKEKGDIGNFLLQFAFLGQSVWGWINWKTSNNLKTSKLQTIERLNLFVGGIFLFFTLYLLSSAFGGNLVILDSITTVISIGGMYLLAKNKIEAWWCWVVADLIYIQFFIQNQLPVSAGLYFIFLVLAIYGWRTWIKEMK